MEQMALNGDTDLDEERAVEKFLRCVPKKYEQLVLSIETLLDFRQLTIEDMTGRLKAAQDHERAPESEAAAGKLLYTAEQWRAFKKKEEEGAGSSKERRRRGERAPIESWECKWLNGEIDFSKGLNTDANM